MIQDKSLSNSLKRLNIANYDLYLNSDIWRAFRSKYYKLSKKLYCRVCKSFKIELHHINYSRLGNEMLTDVIPLCREHHEKIHEWLLDRKLEVGYTLSGVSYLKAERALKGRRS